MPPQLPAHDNDGAAEREDTSIKVKIGDWYWVSDPKRGREDDERWLGCVMDVGSNYAELHGLRYDHSQHSTRVLLAEFGDRCTAEVDIRGVIQSNVVRYKGEVESLLNDVKLLTAELGVQATTTAAAAPVDNTRALSTMSNALDMVAYKASLINAKESLLPELFTAIETATKHLSAWLKAETLPMYAMLDNVKGGIGVIEDRIFNVELYAGLTESVVQIKKGKPAPADTVIHLMQRRAYMDEECLANYTSGGMRFSDLKDFDRWIGKAENLERILPYPRGVISFRVRRESAKYDDTLSIFVNIELEKCDALTFLYIRNGTNLYRLNSSLDFGELLFPSPTAYAFDEPMMIKVRMSDEIEKIITKREYDVMVAEDKGIKRQIRAWEKANPGKHPIHCDIRDKYSWPESLADYEPFDKSSTHYDDARKKITDEIQQYNRIVLIMQGLLDRSLIFHPHPPSALWSAAGFAATIKLIFDDSNVLQHGSTPDFEVYRKHCNHSLRLGSITIGQDHIFLRREAEKENARRQRSPHYRGVEREPHLEEYRPYGNKGPGYLSPVMDCTEEACTYVWYRDRMHNSYRHGDSPIPVRLRVSRGNLFNVSAYKPGDYKRFLMDPRSRMKYLRWAPFLLAAEEYHAGKLLVGVPASRMVKATNVEEESE